MPLARARCTFEGPNARFVGLVAIDLFVAFCTLFLLGEGRDGCKSDLLRGPLGMGGWPMSDDVTREATDLAREVLVMLERHNREKDEAIAKLRVINSRLQEEDEPWRESLRPDPE